MLRATFALAIVCVSLTVVAAQPPKPAVTMDDIKKAWQERQDKVKTLKMSWKQVVVKPKGSLDMIVGRFVASGVTVTKPQPPREVKLVGEVDFTLDLDRFRCDAHRETWWLPSQSPKQFQQLAVFDGTNYSMYTSNSTIEPADRDLTSVHSRAQAVRSVESLELYPVWWCVRGAKDTLGREPLADYETAGQVVMRKGVRCIQLESKSRTNDSRKLLFVTADLYVPVSYSYSKGKHVLVQLDIEYDRSVDTILMPSGWRYVTSFGNGVTNETFEATVLSCAINDPVVEDTFRLNSPSGTTVADTRTAGTERLAVVLPDGTVSRSVDRKTVDSYEELVEAVEPRFQWRPWVVSGVIGVIAGVGGYLLMRSRRRGS